MMTVPTQAAQALPLYVPEMLKFVYAEDDPLVIAELEADEPNIRNPKLWEVRAGNGAGLPNEYIVAPREGLETVGNTADLDTDPRHGLPESQINRILMDPELYGLVDPDGFAPSMMAIVRVARKDFVTKDGLTWNNGGYGNTLRLNDELTGKGRIRVSCRESSGAAAPCEWWRTSPTYSRGNNNDSLSVTMWHPKDRGAWSGPGIWIIIGYYGELTDDILNIPLRGEEGTVEGLKPTPTPEKTTSAPTVTATGNNTPTPTGTGPVWTGTGEPPSPPTTDTTATPPKYGDANVDNKTDIDDILFVRDEIFGANKITAKGRTNLKMSATDTCKVDHILAIRDVIF
ncbi:MAG: hypothetical protein FWD16_06250, partial [Clostridia bacterium]|nr:hypothetical protein [Clostridia bacterium]